MSTRIFPVLWTGGHPYAIVGDVDLRQGLQIVRALDLEGLVPQGAVDVGVTIPTIENARLDMVVVGNEIRDPRHRGARLAPVALRLRITAELVDD